MKVAFKIFAALLLLVSVNAYVLNPQTSSVKEDTTIAESINLLYNAIFNISNLQNYIESAHNFNGDAQQLACINLYSMEDIVTLSTAGAKLCQCMFVSEADLVNYFMVHSVVSFHKKFEHKMSQCSKITNSDVAFKCYAYSIADMLGKISSSGTNNNFLNKQCVYFELGFLVNQLEVQSQELANCLIPNGSSQGSQWIPSGFNFTFPPWLNRPTTASPPWWNSTAVPSLNTTVPWWNTTAAPSWNTTVPWWNTTEVPSWNTTVPWWNTTAAPSWNTTVPWWNTTGAPSWNTTVPWWNTTQVPSLNTTQSNEQPTDAPWWKKIWKDVKEVF